MRRGLLAGLSFALLTLIVASCSTPPPPPPKSLDEVAKGSLAKIEGELKVPGLKEPVEIIRDEAGMPHIYAKNEDDMFFAQGYVMGQDRLWQLEMWRRWREGKLAEIYGPKAVDFDERARLMAFRGPWDEKEWGSYHKDSERFFTAWTNGLNAFMTQNANNLPVEFKLTGIKPEPWTAKTLTLRWAEIGLDSAGNTPAQEIQLAMQVAKMGAAAANKAQAPDPWDNLVVPEGLNVKLITQEVLDAVNRGDNNPFAGDALPPLDIVPEYRGLVKTLQNARLPVEPQDEDGSNNWVVSGKLSPTGMPILANDPHRAIEMPSLRYFVHLVSPGWNVTGGTEPPYFGVDGGSNENMAWGFTFAGIDMVDTFVETVNPADENQTMYNGQWEPMRIIREEIRVKGEEKPRVVELKFTRHGPVFYEDKVNHLAYVAKSVNQEPGTAPLKGSLKLNVATSCEDFFDRAMFWKVPTHNVICGDNKGNIALQVSGLTPDRNGFTGRLPVPGTGKYEWVGFRSDLPREMNPERGYIATANDNTHPPGYKGRPVLYKSTTGVEISRIARIRQMLNVPGKKFGIEDHERMHHDAYSLRAERDQPLFKGWKSKDAEVEKARAMIEAWDKVLTKDTDAGAIYVRWTATDAARQRETGRITGAKGQALVEQGLRQAIDRISKDWGSDWSQWRYGRINASTLDHQFIPEFSLPLIERPGGFNTVNATGANFRRIIDLSNVDNSVWTNAPGQSGQPGSEYYGNNRERLANGQYLPLPSSRAAVEKIAKHRLTLTP